MTMSISTFGEYAKTEFKVIFLSRSRLQIVIMNQLILRVADFMVL